MCRIYAKHTLDGSYYRILEHFVLFYLFYLYDQNGLYTTSAVQLLIFIFVQTKGKPIHQSN